MQRRDIAGFRSEAMRARRVGHVMTLIAIVTGVSAKGKVAVHPSSEKWTVARNAIGEAEYMCGPVRGRRGRVCVGLQSGPGVRGVVCCSGSGRRRS
jgi:hypothetical protein